jgi:hypothetical protein
VCASCGLDTEALRRDLDAAGFYRTAEQRDRLVGLGFKPQAIHRGDFWHADHILEVVEGGGCCGLENTQTLCVPCHKRKTAALAARRAERRRQQKAATDQSMHG